MTGPIRLATNACSSASSLTLRHAERWHTLGSLFAILIRNWLHAARSYASEMAKEGCAELRRTKLERDTKGAVGREEVASGQE